MHLLLKDILILYILLHIIGFMKILIWFLITWRMKITRYILKSVSALFILFWRAILSSFFLQQHQSRVTETNSNIQQKKEKRTRKGILFRGTKPHWNLSCIWSVCMKTVLSAARWRSRGSVSVCSVLPVCKFTSNADMCVVSQWLALIISETPPALC